MNTIENFTTPAAYFDQGYSCGYMDGYNQAIKDSKVLLNKADIDMLVKIVSNVINIYECTITMHKYDIEHYYELCNPEDEGTTLYFKYLNKSKDKLRSNNKKRKKLAELQSKLKKLRGA